MLGMKIGYRTKPHVDHAHVISDLRPHPVAGFARPITNERDYREAKALLGRTMRSARTHDSAIRAEALLREIVDYEVRLDSTDGSDEGEFTELPFGDYDGPKRRWCDGLDD